MLRVAPSGEPSSWGSFLSVDKKRKQITLQESAATNGAIESSPEDRRVGVAAPKMFAFDGLFTQEDAQVTHLLIHSSVS